MTEQRAWKAAIKHVGENMNSLAEVWFDGADYSTEYKAGSDRVGYISESKDGRFWQQVDATSERIELDPAFGLTRPMRY